MTLSRLTERLDSALTSATLRVGGLTAMPSEAASSSLNSAGT
eukprot:CAMPEP_0176386794 /NCGR_PEP_ID=MMETSP0126-20121128/36233_1 /TAXON_ID=141414 ORGANISM="Strombidinopsis acuminatum, Strain SPMC142" /NCGR_SAMPLE_ID=MMETSP0126 /ASSEMBLY_ACC=CAM_ASM_000229 /LENGTH=41 /DNA_ID= /DNA_START= /DNA_END= /DNA_ORIENTATION=